MTEPRLRNLAPGRYRLGQFLLHGRGRVDQFLSTREIRDVSETVLKLNQVSLEMNQASVSLSVPTNLGSHERLPSRW